VALLDFVIYCFIILCQGIRKHFFGGAVEETDLPFFNDITDEVEAYINVLGTTMELMILRQSNSGLILGFQIRWILDNSVSWFKDLINEGADPNAIFGTFGGHNVLGFSSGQRY
jgi:hypothetical protein